MQPEFASARSRPGTVDEADRICRVAFGTFVGVPQPESFFGDADMVRTRWQADPGAALAAEVGGRLAGSNFAANWGSVGFFGPLTVAPEYWDRAIGQRLLDATMELFEAWGTRHAGLFTFAQSAKHVGLYQKYGFWPRFLTAVMSSPVRPDSGQGSVRLSAMDEAGRAGAMAAVRELTDAVYPGLDVSLEIESVLAQGLGDTVLIDDASGLQGVAICHVGAGTEAGGDVLHQVRRRPARSRRRALPPAGTSGPPAAEPPEAEPGQGQGEGQEDRGLGPLEGPVAAGGLVGDGLPDAVAGQAGRPALCGAPFARRLASWQAAGIVLTGCPAALMAPLDRIQAPGWPGTAGRL